MTHCDVFGVGQCSLDFLAPVAVYPKADQKCEFSGMIVQGGGPVATALVALTRWGKKCLFSGVIGDDHFGEEIKKSLQDEGMDVSGLIIRKGYVSQLAFVVAEKTSGRRTIFWQRPTGGPLLPEEVPLELIALSRVIHVDGLFPDASLAACLTARKHEVPVVVDAGSMRDGMIEIAKESDYFIASEKFAQSLVGDAPVEEACRAISALGPKLAAVTLGERGYVALYDDVFIERPAHAVKAIDTTGCGDVFHAGFIYGLLEKWDAEKCLDFGAWAAARVATMLGGRAGIPKLDSEPKPGHEPSELERLFRRAPTAPTAIAAQGEKGSSRLPQKIGEDA